MDLQGLNVVWADPANPRIDIVIGREGEQTRVLAGTPTAGATLQNRLGCPACPEGWKLDCYVLVPPSSGTTISEANVMPNLWTPELDEAVRRIEESL